MSFDPNIERKQVRLCPNCGEEINCEFELCDFCREPLEDHEYSD
jgi:predicted amidophosphoribosyltransferase